MPFMQTNLADAREPKPVPEGEYDLIIKSCDEETSKSGMPMLHVVSLIDGAEGAEALPIHDYLILPHDGYDYNSMALLNLKRFLVAWGIAHEGNGFDTDDFPGSKARLLVVQEEVKDGPSKGSITNRIRYPRLKNEEAEGEDQQRRRRA